MRYFYIIILQFLIISCSVKKAGYAVINDFLDVELKDYKIDSIHVQIEPYDVKEAIQLYEDGYNGRDDQSPSYAKVWTTPEIKDWPISMDEINKIRKNLKGQDIEWSEADFKNKSFVFYHASVLKDMNFRASHRVKGTKEYVLRLSRPVFNKMKTYALFKYYYSELLMGSSPESGHRGAVIMKKENGKWIALASIREAVYE